MSHLSPSLLLTRAWLDVCARLDEARHDERGQSTAEYALVILGAAAVAMMLAAWASGTDKIGQLLDGVVDRVLSLLS
ncbi:MAG: DUF4244 domain-containing protein [Acidimicrobiales bacterium]